MLSLQNLNGIAYCCPCCSKPLEYRGWYMPGMRCVADMKCSACGKSFFVDLPTGHGLIYPAMVDRETGEVFSEIGGNWFSDALRTSFQSPVSQAAIITVEKIKSVDKPVILNCLDLMYGHALLKLLNAPYYIEHHPEKSLVLIVPKYLRWLVPDGVAMIVTVDQPLSKGGDWNNGIADELYSLLDDYPNLFIAMACPHPHLDDFNIEKFTRVKPFNIRVAEASNQWNFTFIWRDDRLWWPGFPPGKFRTLTYKITRRLGFIPMPPQMQLRNVTALAETVRELKPGATFAVAGLGEPGGFPPWIQDQRKTRPSADDEKQWCEQYAKSSVVIGIHGSNMILPSAHAGAVIDLIDPAHMGNISQDMLPSVRGSHEAIARYLNIPLTTSVPEVAALAVSLATFQALHDINYNRPWNDHEFIERDPLAVSRRFSEITKKAPHA